MSIIYEVTRFFCAILQSPCSVELMFRIRIDTIQFFASTWKRRRQTESTLTGEKQPTNYINRPVCCF